MNVSTCLSCVAFACDSVKEFDRIQARIIANSSGSENELRSIPCTMQGIDRLLNFVAGGATGLGLCEFYPTISGCGNWI